MMICPEVYYEDNLKGKAAEEHKKTIRGLQISIGKLKKSIEFLNLEHEFNDFIAMYPSPSTHLWWEREYLKIVKQGLKDLDVEYIPSKLEMKDMKFQENIVNIKEIVFYIGGYFRGHKTYNIKFINEDLFVTISDLDDEKEVKLLNVGDEVMDRQCFLYRIKELHIGEWKRNYSTLDLICDGTQWSLEILYNNGLKKTKFRGDNLYPYNFDDFIEIFNKIEVLND